MSQIYIGNVPVSESQLKSIKTLEGIIINFNISELKVLVSDSSGREAYLYLDKSQKETFSKNYQNNKKVLIYADTFLYGISFND